MSQKVLHGEQVLEILGKADTIAKTECICRSKIKGCDAPTDVCIVLDDTAEKHIQDGRGQKITIEKARKILDMTAEFGLVHLCINQKGYQPKAICSCCSCCCHDLRSMLEFGNDFRI